MRNPLSRQPGEGPRPTLRERAASLRAAAARLIRGGPTPPAEPPAPVEPVPPPLPTFGTPDLIHALIERHRSAWYAFQMAPPGEPTIIASDELDAVLQALLGTGCETPADAVDLLRHLQWFLRTEGINNPPENFDWRVAQARAIDLALLLGPAVSRPG